MVTALIFDTCVLPQKGGLTGNPIMSALLRIAKIKNQQVLISELVRAEALAERHRAASDALEKLRTAIRAAAKVFGDSQLDFYLPSEADAVDAWQRELDALGSIPLEGDDAIAALHREANRVPPTRPTEKGSAIGSRDAAIWLSIVRFHSDGSGRTTYFVSSNTADFADANDKNRLRSELVSDLGSSAERFTYFSSLSGLVSHLAESTPTRDVTTEFIYQLEHSTDILAQLAEATAQKTSTDPRLMRVVTALNITSAVEVRAYSVDDTRLSMVDATFTFESTLPEQLADVGPAAVHTGEARVWLYETDQGIAVELDSVRPSTQAA